MVVVLFKIKKAKDSDSPQYRADSARMHELLETLPGYISGEAFYDAEGVETNIVHFESLEALDAWHNHPDHVLVQQHARESYYDWYHVEVLVPVREYEFTRGQGRREIIP